MSNYNNMLRQAQALQKKMEKAQQDLAGREVTGTAGGGVVTVTMNGSGEVLGLRIDPQVVDPEDVDMLQDLVVAALNEALRASKDLEQDLMGDLAGGLGLPPGLL